MTSCIEHNVIILIYCCFSPTILYKTVQDQKLIVDNGSKSAKKYKITPEIMKLKERLDD